MSKLVVCGLLGAFAGGVLVGALLQGSVVVSAQGDKRVFELRTYTTNDGKLGDLHARFRNHTTKLFQKHGITNVGYWAPQDAPLSQNTLVYMLAYPNREEAKKRWSAFTSDPEWATVRTASEANGRIVAKVDSVFMDPTDFSPIK